MANARKKPPVASSLTSQIDKEAAVAAYRKAVQGQVPTSRERSALKRYEAEQEEQRRWQYYGSIPKKHWREMSGRQVKVINEQGATYNLPLEGRTIDLPKFVRAFHNFLAVNARKLSSDDDGMMSGDSGSAALEDYRSERAKLARLERKEREGSLVQRDHVREGLGRIAAIVRVAGEAVQRQYGLAAAQLLYDALDDAEREMQHAFGIYHDASDPNEQCGH